MVRRPGRCAARLHWLRVYCLPPLLLPPTCQNARGPADPTDGRVYDPYISTAYSSEPLFRLVSSAAPQRAPAHSHPATTTRCPCCPAQGHGLSYTTFAYRSLAVTLLNASAMTPPAVVVGAPISGRGRAGYAAAFATAVLSANVTLCNTGAVAGTEVVQVYSQDPRGLGTSRLAVVPFWKRLVGYGRIALAPGACGSLTVPVTADDLALYDDAMTLRVLPGTYVISAGGRSDTDTLQQTVEM